MKKYKYNIHWHGENGCELKQVDGYDIGEYKGLKLFIFKDEIVGQWIPTELTTGMHLEGVSGHTIKAAITAVKSLLDGKDIKVIEEARDWQIKTYGIAN